MKRDLRKSLKLIAILSFGSGAALLLVVAYVISLPLGKLDYAAAATVPGKVYRDVLLSLRAFVFVVVPGLCLLNILVGAQILSLVKRCADTETSNPEVLKSDA